MSSTSNKHSTYDSIERPFGPHLEREGELGVVAGGAPASGMGSSADGSGTTSPSGGGNVADTPVKSAQSMADLWIENEIRSKNWSPKKTGFYINGQTGYAEFANIHITGTLTVISSGSIGGWTIAPTEIYNGNVHVKSTAEQILMGLATAPLTGAGVFLGKDGSDYEFRAGDPSGAYMHWNGSSLTLKGGIIQNVASGSDLTLLGWQNDTLFSATDYDTVEWSSGTLRFANGVNYSISAGSTGNMSAVTYIYLDTAVSTTALQTTTTASNAVGINKVLIAVAEDNTDTAKNAIFQVFGGAGGMSPLITADNIAADSITANEIAANTITGTEISSVSISGKTLVADTGTIGGFTMSATTLTATNLLLDAANQRIALGSSNDIIILDADDATYRMWIGHATAGSAPFSVTKAGAVAASNIAITGGSITGTPISSVPNNSSTDISLLDLTHTLVFSVTDSDTVAWASGTITMSNGRTFSITGSNTGNMSSRTYIYLDPGVSSTALQTTTTASTAMGANKKLIAVAQNSSGQATFQVYAGIGGIKVGSSQINLANNNWVFTGTWSVTDADTVAWGAGTFKTSDGTSYSISGSNTGNMSAKTYIYFDLGTSSTAFQTTTTATTAIGDGKILVAIAQNGTGEATYMVMNEKQANIDAAQIVAGSITANEIAAGAITAAKIDVSQLSAITADMGAITAGTITLNTSGHIKGGQTAWDTGTGFFLGYSTDAYKFSIGDGTAENSLTWDGSRLVVNGYDQTGIGVSGGDGSDGALNVTGTTTLNAGQLYQFSSITIGASGLLRFTGNGIAMILCSGNMSMTSTSIIDLRFASSIRVGSIVGVQALEGGEGYAAQTLAVGGTGGSGDNGDEVDGTTGGTGGAGTGSGNGAGGAGGSSAGVNGSDGNPGTTGVTGGGGGGGGYGANGAGSAGSAASGMNGGDGGDGSSGLSGDDGGGGGGGGGAGTGTGNGGNGGDGLGGNTNQGNGGNGGASGPSGGNGGNGGNGRSPGAGGDGYVNGGNGGNSTANGSLATGGAGGAGRTGVGGTGGTGASSFNSGGGDGGRGGDGGTTGGNGGNGSSGNDGSGGDGGRGGDGVNGVIPLYLFVKGNMTLDGTVKAHGADGGNGGNGGASSDNLAGGLGGDGGDGSDGSDVFMICKGTYTDNGIDIQVQGGEGGEGGVSGANGSSHATLPSQSDPLRYGLDGIDGRRGRVIVGNVTL